MRRSQTWLARSAVVCCAVIAGALTLLACSGPAEPEPSIGAGAGASGAPAARLMSWGERCSHNTDCDTGTCGFGLGYCTRPCLQPAECPSLWRCELPNGGGRRLCQR